MKLVVVGSSAGGLQELETIFGSLPAMENMAFLVIQHSDPEIESNLGDIIERDATMPVHAIEEGMEIEPANIYVHPSSKNVLVENHTFTLKALEENDGLRLPIDVTLDSVAHAFGEHAVCIILSGTGSDGSNGAKKVKAEGGIVYVQDPEEAEFPGMPQSVIETGLVDAKLSVDEIPVKLINLQEHPHLVVDKGEPDEEIDDFLRSVFKQVRKSTGHDFSEYKTNTILRRIDRRMAANEITEMDDYRKFLNDNDEEAEKLFREFLISVTNFFRDEEAFEQLRKEVLEPMFRDAEEHINLRIWVPGCATGEEAYSVAIMVAEIESKYETQNTEVQIFASDIDEDAIEFARVGEFDRGIEADLSKERLNKYFSVKEEKYKVKKFIREMIIFAPHNVLKDPPFINMDLICCRNMLIYMKPKIQNKVLSLFYHSLNEYGYLFLGSSESVKVFSEHFDTIDKSHKIYQRIEETQVEKPSFPDFTPERTLRLDNEYATKKEKEEKHKKITRVAERIILNDYTFPTVLINEQNQVIYFSGKTEKFLKPAPGEASFDIMKMAGSQLDHKLGAIISDAKDKEQKLVREDVQIIQDDTRTECDIIVRPISRDEGDDYHYLVVFKEKREVELHIDEAEEAESQSEKVQALQKELQSTKEYLQSTINELQMANEDLKSANEELQAKNEELQSTNEELQTSKEEVKSTNEELKTVNDELKTKIDELSRAKNDIYNLLVSTDIATVFLDKDLKVKRFTPKSKEVLNLVSSDKGRHIDEIKMKIDYDELTEDAEYVLETLNKIEKEKEHQEGHRYSVQIMPYRTVENVIEGVVITFVDNTRFKTSSRLAEMVKRSPDAITIMDPNGKIEFWNNGAEELYGYSENEALKMNIAELTTEKRRDETKEMLESIKQGNYIRSLHTERKTKAGKTLRVWLKTVALLDEDDNVQEISTTERDVTEFKQREKELEERIAELENQLS